MKLSPVLTVASLSLLVGCASYKAPSQSKLDAMSCAELNVAVGDSANQISATAISRGNIARRNVPNWLPGITKAKSVLEERRTNTISEITASQAEIVAARDRRCR